MIEFKPFNDTETQKIKMNFDRTLLNKYLIEQWLTSAGVLFKYKSLTTMLSMYGLKSANDVINFLQSPAGESVYHTIADHLHEINRLAQQQKDNINLILHKKHVLAAYFLLGMLWKKRHDAKLNTAHDDEERNLPSYTMHDQSLIAEQYFEAYELSLNMLQFYLDEKKTEASALTNEIDKILQHEKDFKTEHLLINKHLYEIENFYQMLMSNEKKLDIDEQILSKLNEINLQLTKLTEYQNLNSNKINSHQFKALNAQKTILNELLKPHSLFFKPSLTKRPLSKENYAVINNHGTYYLIPKTKNFMELNLTEKTAARKDFKNLTIIKTMQNQILATQQKQLEIQMQNKTNIMYKSQILQNTIIDINQQINKLKMAYPKTRTNKFKNFTNELLDKSQQIRAKI